MNIAEEDLAELSKENSRLRGLVDDLKDALVEAQSDLEAYASKLPALHTIKSALQHLERVNQ